MEKAGEALQNMDLETAMEIQPIEARVDEINKALSDKHIERLKNGRCKIENGITIVEIYTCLERIADHCFNISVCLIQFSEQHFRQHDFESRFNRENPRYKELYKKYAELFALPEPVPQNVSKRSVD